MSNPKKINQDAIYQFLMSHDFKTWFLDRFDDQKPSQPYNQFMFSFSRFLELKGTGVKFHFKVGKKMCTLQVTDTGRVILTFNEGAFISGLAECPIIPPSTIFS